MSDRQFRYGGMVESLESRRLFSSSILGPSAIEGTFKGEAFSAHFPTGLEGILKVTATSESLTVKGAPGVSDLKDGLSVKAFIKLRKGIFSFSIDKPNVTFSMSGSVTDGGKRIAGTFTAIDDGEPISGTFVFKKVPD